MNGKVLGICGLAGSGKDSLAKALIRIWPGAERFAFSDGISAYARIERWMTTRNPSLLQDVGAELLRTRDPLVWCRVVEGAIADRQPDLAIVTGVRRHVEVSLIHSLGGYVLRTRRLMADGSDYVATDRDSKHVVESEIPQLAFDGECYIPDGQLEAVESAAKDIAFRLKRFRSV